jgi:transcriptional regulator with PAS, ATPase and Fis domain
MTEDRSAVSMTLSTEGVAHVVGGIELVVVERRRLVHYPLSSEKSVSVGRAHDCDIVLNDPAASRRHAVVHVAGGLFIEDLESHNGTRVRGAPLVPRQRAALRVGDSIQIGGATLLVRHGARHAEGRRMSGEVERAPHAKAIVLADARMQAVYDLIQRVAPTMVTVLVCGETGVGKELVAEAIHRASGTRSARPLVRINCAALPGALVESELFGHERGAFTGASAGKPGLLEAADRGTVFLDEIGELPLAAQAKLLRALEAREVTRVGGLRARPIDVRFVAATNRDLCAEVARGNFRDDLYFRLNGVTVTVPPLRERTSDIEPLARHFLDDFCRQLGRPSPTLTPSALERLLCHPWPGNVRELRNVLESAVLHAASDCIEDDLLPPSLGQGALGPVSSGPTSCVGASLEDTKPLRSWTDAQRAERHRILDALAACNGNQTRAAEWLNMPRRTLVAKLSAYAIPRPRKPLADRVR